LTADDTDIYINIIASYQLQHHLIKTGAQQSH